VHHLTLDDAATLLLQLEPGDLDDLARLREALTTLVFENRVPITAQPHVARAARLLGTLTDGTADTPAAVLTDVSRAIEAAMSTADALEAAATLATPLHNAAVTPRASAAPAAPAPAPVASVDDPSLDVLPDDTDLDLLGDFLTESMESLTAAESALLELEADPSHEEAINTVFRAFHTVKGTSAFLGLGRIAAFAHEAESLLSRVRDGEIAYTRACAELSLASRDMLMALLDAVRDAAALEGPGVRPLRVPPGYHALLDALATYDPAHEPAIASRMTETARTALRAAEPTAPEATVAKAAAVAAPEAAAPASRTGAPANDATIRVRTDRLDRLIDMVGELVIAQSMIAGDSELDQRVQHELTRKITHAGKIVRELQDLSMSMRMVELRPTFQKLARVVRDTAVKAGKEVTFTVTSPTCSATRSCTWCATPWTTAWSAPTSAPRPGRRAQATCACRRTTPPATWSWSSSTTAAACTARRS
jgi:two-component system chemotaxis sensor kinase CheA